MGTYVTGTGFVGKTLLGAKEEIETYLKGAIFASLNFAAQAVFGQIIGIFSERLSEIWDALEEVYASQYPDTATGQSLDSVCSITGTTREAATHSTVTATLGGTVGTVIPLGSQASVASSGVKFETLAAATIGGGGTITVACQAVETGPLVCLAGTLTVIETPVSGWDTVTNVADAIPGSDVETDAELRLRRETELRNPSNAAVEAIKAHVEDVDGVTGVVVFENVGMVTDGDGIPAKAIETVVTNDGSAVVADIREAIFECKAAGIQAYGTSSGTVVDSMGISHTIAYSPATEKNVYIIQNVTYDEEHYPVDGDAQILAAILAYGDANYVMGKNVVSGALAAQAFSVEGVLEVECLIGLSNPPTTSTTIPISLRELAVLDSARTVINSTPGTP